MAGELTIDVPQPTEIELQIIRNRDLDKGSIDKLLENFPAAYHGTAAFGQAYWDRVGVHGVEQLQKFGLWKQAILAWFGNELPEHLAWIATAGDTLEAHQDGTVTIKA